MIKKLKRASRIVHPKQTAESSLKQNKGYKTIKWDKDLAELIYDSQSEFNVKCKIFGTLFHCFFSWNRAD